MAEGTKKDELQPIIVKKIKKGGGHHGGAWKVAYADFVTAMMAFFLLLWLLNVTTEEAKQIISNYFDPSATMIAESVSGAGGVMGGTSTAPEGAQTTNVQSLTAPQPTGQAGKAQEADKTDEPPEKGDLEKMKEALKKQEAARFEEAMEELKKALSESPALAELAKNLIIDITPEGLRIQIVDQDGKPLFPIGSTEMYDYTRILIGVVARVAMEMPNDISVRGHTDSHQYAPGATYTNWELSADRANASRRALLESGIPESRIANAMGMADREPLIPEDPLDPQNRRITILLLRETLADAMARGAFGEAGENTTEAQGGDDASSYTPVQPEPDVRKTEGEVYFP